MYLLSRIFASENKSDICTTPAFAGGGSDGGYLAIVSFNQHSHLGGFLQIIGSNGPYGSECYTFSMGLEQLLGFFLQ